MPLEKREKPASQTVSEMRYSRFGAYIRQMREDYGLKQEEIADYCLVSRTQIVNLERGRFAPSADLIFRLAEAFGYQDCIGDFLVDAGYTNRTQS